MTRKILLAILLILSIIGCYQVVFGSQDIIRTKVASVSQLSSASRELNTEAAQLEKSCTTDFQDKKSKLAKAIQEYRDTKEEYESVIPQYVSTDADSLLAAEESGLKDIYDVDFLWTIVGNYATEEGVNLQFDINKNTTSASSLNNSSSSYVVCDLQFVITGSYINLTDFIYDIEDDDRLNFEINDFDMQKLGEDLQVTLTVKEIKVNATNLIESNVTSTLSDLTDDTEDEDETTEDSTNTTTDTQTIDTDTTTDSVN